MAVGNYVVYGWAAAEPFITVRLTGVPRRFSLSELKRHFEGFGPDRIPDRTWSSAASGVVQLLVQPCPAVVLPHFVNVVDPQGLLCRVFTKVTFGISRKSKFYTKMALFSRNFEQFRMFSYYFLYDISYNLA
jgi:hypothetical protein